MIKAHKIRLNPTQEQVSYFNRACGVTRFAFNWGLAEWKKSKEENPDKQCGVMELKKKFNSIKDSEFPFVNEVARDAYAGGFSKLQKAMSNYFSSKSGKRKGKKVGFVNFKSKKNKKQSFYVSNDRVFFEDHAVRLPLIGWIDMYESLRFDGKVMSATVSRVANRWYVSVAVEVENKPVVHEKETVGVDLGIKTLMVLSDGLERENKAPLRSNLTKLKRLNRSLSRKVKFSKRWYRAKDRLALYHLKISDRRSDYIHKATSFIAKKYKFIAVEDLNVDGMKKNHKIALSISDASFGEIVRQLKYKSEFYGGYVYSVDRFYPSSKTCGHCGFVNKELTLSDREWTCLSCNSVHNRDLNAAKNLEQEMIRNLGSEATSR